MKIVVNAISTKKNSGGAFQVASNFIFKTLEHHDIEWYYFVSNDLHQILADNFGNLEGIKYFVFPTQPDFANTYRRVKKQLSQIEDKINPDLIYSISSPCYFSFKTTEIMRFTNPWVTHSNKYCWDVLPFKRKITNFLRIALIKKLIKPTQYFVTQTETCKRGILKITRLSEDRVKVVNNVLPNYFNNIDNRPYKIDNEYVNVACVGNPFPHKNFDIIPDVLENLRSLGVENIRFHTTIPHGSTIESKIKTRLEKLGLANKWVNYGVISQQELSELYKKCQLCYLPTLLEVFSASTVEAMYFNLPIVATDLPFNRDVLEDSCVYCLPKDSKDAADKLIMLSRDYNLQDVLKNKMVTRLQIYGDYNAHFNTIKEFLVQVVNNQL